ncbi:MAG TPA: serine hydrolase [Anaerolineales bacterium]|jgi:beta-lactamase class A
MIPAIEALIQQYPKATIAVAFYDEATGEEVLIHASQPFHPASTIKVAVMMEVYHQAWQGTLSLDERLPLTNEFKSIVDGSPFSMDSHEDSEPTLYQRLGQNESIRELLRLMITMSSNFATNLLLKRVTPRSVTAFIRSLGIQDILVIRGPEDNKAYALGLNNVASAGGLMRLLRELAAGRVVSSTASSEMIEVMLEQAFNEGIPAGLPAGMAVAHKTGWNEKLYHDAAIVFPTGRKPYILVVMTQAIPLEQDAHTLVAAISRRCYETITKQS